MSFLARISFRAARLPSAVPMVMPKGLAVRQPVPVARAEDEAHRAPVNETISWRNPESGNYGTVTPVREGVSSSGRQCREYYHTVTVGGRQEEAYGTACLQPDGSWQVVNG